jgi:ribosomal-protein-alanine N-acetyltransferase
MLELSGPTLTLRPPIEADVPALFALGSDPEVTRWFSWGPYRSEAQPRAWVQQSALEREAGEALSFAILRDGELLGVTALTEHSRRDRRAIVGTWIAPVAWGTGVNAESKAIVLHLSFAVLGLRRVGAYADVANIRSQRALEKLGFRREGELRRWHRHGDEHLDVYLYGLLAEEFSTPWAITVRGAPPATFLTPGATPS